MTEDYIPDEIVKLVDRDCVKLDRVAIEMLGVAIAFRLGLGRARRQLPSVDLFWRDRDPFEEKIIEVEFTDVIEMPLQIALYLFADPQTRRVVIAEMVNEGRLADRGDLVGGAAEITTRREPATNHQGQVVFLG